MGFTVKVCEMIYKNVVWRMDILRELLLKEVLYEISGHSIPNNALRDEKSSWIMTPDGGFSTRSAYDLLEEHLNLGGPPTCKDLNVAYGG
ncbi:hypothetical protein RJT34_18275 [Clitoria ternatea]|uniref:Uncharacterized protein n=1 Tax=Clitoria ternatea TaxID=43366 RepID=A0AAN9PE42_CLITE